MLASSLLCLLGSSYLVYSAPVITGVKLNAAATAEAQQLDNTATRAFTAAQITTSDGQCLFVDPTSGDFRENLTPVQIKPCDGSIGQKWDVITAGKHNNQLGFALIVSSQTNACLNFDPRRAAGKQVNLFSCGGRADGSGRVTDSQLFPFKDGQTKLSLQPKSGDNGVCMAPVNGLLDQVACSGDATQIFTIGEPGAPASVSSSTSTSPPELVVTPPSPPSPAVSQPVPGIKTGVKLNPEAVAEAQQRDDSATRAVTGAPIKTSDGQCLFVDPTSGDFRENLTPVQIKPCDGSAGQKWDVITAGKHNNQPGFALIVSAETNACLNFDPRRAAGNQVNLFSCGGRADGSGRVTESQLFPFNSGQTTLSFQPKNGNNATCLAPVNGRLDQVTCSEDSNQVFTIGDGTPSPVSTAPSPPAPPVSTPPVSAPPVSTPPVSTVKTGVKIDSTAVAEAHQRDNTATRAFTGVPIKTSDGQCLFIDPTSGDFRENLTPIQIKPCDGSEGQKWDFITAGKHNNKPGSTIIVSSLTNACLNFDDRRAPGNQVLLFSCGGRADGTGTATDSQLFPFKDGQRTLALTPQNAKGAVCLAPVNNLLDRSSCSGAASAKGNQIFTIG